MNRALELASLAFKSNSLKQMSVGQFHCGPEDTVPFLVWHLAKSHNGHSLPPGIAQSNNETRALLTDLSRVKDELKTGAFLFSVTFRSTRLSIDDANH